MFFSFSVLWIRSTDPACFQAPRVKVLNQNSQAFGAFETIAYRISNLLTNAFFMIQPIFQKVADHISLRAEQDKTEDRKCSILFDSNASVVWYLHL